MRTVSGSRNRTILLILGIVLLLAGVLLGALASGLAAQIPGVSSWAPESSAALGSLLGPLNQHLLVLGIAATVLAALFGLWWLLAQIPRKDRTSPYRLQDDADHGIMTVDPKVLAQAVEDQLQALPGVTRAHADLAGSAHHPELTAKLTLAARTSVDRVLGEVYGTVVTDLETALETRLEHVGLQLDVARESAGDSKTSTRGTSARTGADQQPALQ